MLQDSHKSLIRNSYTTFLDSKGLSSRRGQQVMIAEVAKTIGGIPFDEEGSRLSDYENHLCVVEAGTGTGKTISYLLPSIILAKELGKKLVVSTATVALQEQIVNKDIPDLLKHAGVDFSYTLAKGRGRYMCLNKLSVVLDESSKNESPLLSMMEDFDTSLVLDRAPYKKMDGFYRSGAWDGEKDTWKDKITDKNWNVIATDSHSCSGKSCVNYNKCSFYKARSFTYSADCIVANHDLVLADLSLGGGIVLPSPEESIFIFDEAHHLPQKALSHFAANMRMSSTGKWVDQSVKALDLVYATFQDDKSISSLEAKIRESMTNAKKGLNALGFVLQPYSLKFASDRSLRNYRFPNGTVPDDLILSCANLSLNFDSISSNARKMRTQIQELLNDPMTNIPREEVDSAYSAIGSILFRAESCLNLFKSYSQLDSTSKPPLARWIEPIFHDGSLDLHLYSSPILAAETLKLSLWDRVFGAVLTSATMRALGSFENFIEKSGTPNNSNYHVVQSPFDFSQAVFSIPKNATEANDADRHTASIVTGLPDIVDDKDGTLVLFSSKKQMKTVYESISEKMRKMVLVQGDYSKQEILDLHKEKIDRSEGSIIFGLDSFSEGVDLPGRYCNHVIISKLPFAVPDNPIEAALSEWIDKSGRNSFMELSVPAASIKLIQASGRLLRKEGDSGRITIFDKRLVTKRYGSMLIDSLPPFTFKLR